MRTNEFVNKKIVCDKEYINGNPRLDGTRLSVLDVISGVERNGLNEFLADYNYLTKDDIRAAVNYCSDRQCDHDKSHCGGCSLRPHQDGIFTKEQFINRFKKVCFEDSDEVIMGSGEGVMIMPGTSATLDQTWFGVNGWIIAGKLKAEIFTDK